MAWLEVGFEACAETHASGSLSALNQRLPMSLAARGQNYSLAEDGGWVLPPKHATSPPHIRGRAALCCGQQHTRRPNKWGVENTGSSGAWNPRSPVSLASSGQDYGLDEKGNVSGRTSVVT